MWTKLFNSFLSNDYFNVNKLCLGKFVMGHNFMQMKLCKKEVKGGGKITLHAVLYIYFDTEWDLYLCVCRSSVEKMPCSVRSRSAVTPGITCWCPKPCTRTPQLKPVIFIITFRWLHESSNYKQRMCKWERFCEFLCQHLNESQIFFNTKFKNHFSLEIFF